MPSLCGWLSQAPRGRVASRAEMAVHALAISVLALWSAPRALPLRLATGGAARAGAPPRLSSLSLEETKASLCKKLLYNKRLDPQGEALLDALVDSGGQADAPGEEWWAGKFILRSCHEFARALRAAGAGGGSHEYVPSAASSKLSSFGAGRLRSPFGGG